MYRKYAFHGLPPTMTYDEVVEFMRSGRGVVLDVRSPDEVKNDGGIGRYVNIAHTELEDAMKLDDAEYQRKFGMPKPRLTDPIVTSCRSGKRAGIAAETLKKLGFSNISVYTGSFLEWAEKQKNPVTAYQPEDIRLPETVDYEQLVKFMRSGRGLVLDVRRPDEVQEGALGRYVNIPHKEIEAAMALDDAEFQRTFNVPKPGKGEPIITSCRSGVRAGKAAATLRGLGFDNVSIYSGSFLDWTAKQADPATAYSA